MIFFIININKNTNKIKVYIKIYKKNYKCMQQNTT